MIVYLIAGEASGDLHASGLMRAMSRRNPEICFRCFGGDLMREAGGVVVKHYRDMAFMGFIPVLLNIRKVLNNLKECKKDILNTRPDAIILIDYPGFNLKIAKFVKNYLPDTKVFYYISPKIWAWKRYRIKTIRKYIDKMLCILPFETAFYETLNYPVQYVGNPSVDAVERYRQTATAEHTERFRKLTLTDKPILAILPGSRKAEIADNLPTMLKAAARFPDFQPVIAGAPGMTLDDYKTQQNHIIIFNQTYDILNNATVALVTSGTATLETALFRLPQVVCYHLSSGKLANFIFRHFFSTPYISLVNLIAEKKVVKELFGGNFTETNIASELNNLINNQLYRSEMLKDYDRIIIKLGSAGASDRAAEEILKNFSEKIL
ncbi:MAG: lipid-A-disaccharide synthase [Tannerella sp.]|jgi:lipid-A-disaccharide synthase|nr:lipid-A-disaccharide synthase [Tannerella sp.]